MASIIQSPQKNGHKKICRGQFFTDADTDFNVSKGKHFRRNGNWAECKWNIEFDTTGKKMLGIPYNWNKPKSVIQFWLVIAYNLFYRYQAKNAFIH